MSFEPMSAAIKKQLHDLVDQIPETAQRAAVDVLRYLSESPVLVTAEDAPDDDEPFTDEQRAAVEQSEKDFERGDFISQDELRKKLGL